MKSISRLFLSGLLLVSLAQPLFAEPELKGSPSELTEYLKDVPKVVTVSGESEVKVEADKAVVSLRVRTENKSFQEALRLNQGIRGKIIGFLTERGMAPEQIKAAKLSSMPNHAIFSDKIKTYTVENILKITVRDEKEFQAVASAADGWPEVHYDGAEFEHSNKQEMKIKAVRQACENATARKKVFEETLGVKLVAKRFIERAIAEPLVQNRAYYSADVSKTYESSPSAQGGIPPGAIAETMSSFGELTFKAQVAVEYSLEGK